MVNSLPVRGLICVWSCVILMACCGSAEAARRGRTGPKPKERLSFYLHDILYNGHNEKNATSAIVAAPQGANLTSLSGRKMNFGDVVVFDDPITLQPRLRAPQIGRAQGFYFYDQKLRLSAWLAFTAVLDTPRHKGTLCFAGADPIYKKTRDIAVVGGTGDFVLARGIATVMTHSFEDTVYFRLLLNVSLY